MHLIVIMITVSENDGLVLISIVYSFVRLFTQMGVRLIGSACLDPVLYFVVLFFLSFFVQCTLSI